MWAMTKFRKEFLKLLYEKKIISETPTITVGIISGESRIDSTTVFALKS